jgi:hypothetical protein
MLALGRYLRLGPVSSKQQPQPSMRHGKIDTMPDVTYNIGQMAWR